MIRAVSFSAVLACLVFLASGHVDAGSAGIRNGGIQGVVYDDSGQPLPGVNVVAQRTSNVPNIIRSATTDEMGNYFIGDLYLGEYSVGFAKFGYKTLDTSGAGGSGTPTGPAVKTFVDSGQTSIVPRVSLMAEPDTTAGTLTVNAVDITSSAGIPNATVHVGAFSASAGAEAGSYKVPVRPAYDAAGLPQPQSVQILAEGFEPFTGAVTVTAGQTSAITFRLNPSGAEINGRVVAMPPGVDLSTVAIRVPNVNPAFTAGTVTPEGNFTLKVPASTPSIPRLFTINFSMLGFKTASIQNVSAPMGGALTLPSDVILAAQQVTVAGSVFMSNSQPGGDSVLVRELGKAFGISNGQFTIQVPAGRPLTLVVRATNNGILESGEATVTAQGDDTPGSVFNIPPIITR